jgi:uncharacterized protein YeaO (DUF488 family)
MIQYNHDKKEWEGFTVEYIKSLEAAYPMVDVVRELKYRMPLWINNAGKKGKKKKWERFITNWLSRQQAKKEEVNQLRLNF